jgi:hypothetical protein
MRFLILITTMLIISLAFAKATPKKGSSNSSSHVTAPPVHYSAQLQIDDSQAPRAIGGSLYGKPGVQACLREALLRAGDDFAVTITGDLKADGEISNVSVEHQYDSLRDCLSHEVANTNVGPGAAGAFKIEISRVRVTPPPEKTYLLDLNEPKKFQ